MLGAFEKYVCILYSALGRNRFKLSIRSSWLMVFHILTDFPLVLLGYAFRSLLPSWICLFLLIVLSVLSLTSGNFHTRVLFTIPIKTRVYSGKHFADVYVVFSLRAFRRFLL